MEVFLSVICDFLDKSLFQFDPKTHTDLVLVTIQVVNSKPGAKIIGNYNYTII